MSQSPWQQMEETQEAMHAARDAAVQRANAARRALPRLEAVTAEAWSPRREVRVALDSGGMISDVEFSDSVAAVSPSALGRAFQRAHDEALSAWADDVEAIAEEEYADEPALRATTLKAAQDARPVLDEPDDEG